MITRIVKMKFDSEHVNVFIKIFNESAGFIQAFDGCLKVDLLKDINQDDCFFTISQWENENDLNNIGHLIFSGTPGQG